MQQFENCSTQNLAHSFQDRLAQKFSYSIFWTNKLSRVKLAIIITFLQTMCTANLGPYILKSTTIERWIEPVKLKSLTGLDLAWLFPQFNQATSKLNYTLSHRWKELYWPRHQCQPGLNLRQQFCWRTPSYLIPREWWNCCTSPRLKMTIFGEATNKIQGLHVSVLFSSVWDQNGELFVACSLDLRAFSPLFRSLSDVKALEIYFQYQWNPLAYNYITTVKKEPLLSRLVVLIL